MGRCQGCKQRQLMGVGLGCLPQQLLLGGGRGLGLRPLGLGLRLRCTYTSYHAESKADPRALKVVNVWLM